MQRTLDKKTLEEITSLVKKWLFRQQTPEELVKIYKNKLKVRHFGMPNVKYKNMKQNLTKYPTFKTCCMVCNKKLVIQQFTIHAGMHSFALCPKHYEELLKKYKLG